MQVQPYVFFEGRCEEALNFYKSAVGAEITALMRYKDSPAGAQPGMTPPNSAEKIMHASFRIGETTILASDGHCSGTPAVQGFALTLIVPTEAEATRHFNALAAGGKTLMPLAKTFFSPSFGMLADRFGVMWMIYVGP
jgi:PhnB protein